MGLVINASREGDAEGVSLAQLADAVERATRECLEHGVNTREIFPAVQIKMNGKIKKISIEV